MNREDLIEDAAKAMYFEDCGVAALEDDAEPFREMARAALAVFEGASLSVTDSDHSELLANVASSDDEREALIAFLLKSRVWNVADRADEILRMLHRTVQGEPTDVTLSIMAQAFYSATSGRGSGIHYDSMMVKPEIVEGMRAALRAAAIEGGQR